MLATRETSAFGAGAHVAARFGGSKQTMAFTLGGPGHIDGSAAPEGQSRILTVCPWAVMRRTSTPRAAEPVSTRRGELPPSGGICGRSLLTASPSEAAAHDKGRSGSISRLQQHLLAALLLEHFQQADALHGAARAQRDCRCAPARGSGACGVRAWAAQRGAARRGRHARECGRACR